MSDNVLSRRSETGELGGRAPDLIDTYEAGDRVTAAGPSTITVAPATVTRRAWHVRAERSVAFDVCLCHGLFASRNSPLFAHDDGASTRRLVMVDAKVAETYEDAITSCFEEHGVKATLVALSCSEAQKSLASLTPILRAMEDFAVLRRSEPVIAIGGGVLLDRVGVASGLYRRGIPYIRVPTTLVALVDVSVATKVAVNHFAKRNRLGLYYPPLASYLDPLFLKTLPQRALRDGLGEILKLAVICDAPLFKLVRQHASELIEERFQSTRALEVIESSVSRMIRMLRPNLWELDLKRLVDFGHSFSPLIEMTAQRRLSHGHAVALDVLYSAIISNQRGLLSDAELSEIYSACRKSGLPVRHEGFEDPVLTWRALSETMVHRDGAQNLPLPIAIGEAIFVNDVTRAELSSASGVMTAWDR